MAIEIRNPSGDEWRAAMLMTSSVFGDEPNDEELERHRKMLVRERFYAAYDDDAPVGTAADFPFTLTVPGGELAAGGATWVAVLPSHRRQGVLTQLMRRELDDLHERGEPLAVLWASEAAIYGRFGYGMAAPHFDMDADRSRFALRDDPGPRGKVRMVSLAEALKPCTSASGRERLDSSHGLPSGGRRAASPIPSSGVVGRARSTSRCSSSTASLRRTGSTGSSPSGKVAFRRGR